MDRMVNNAGDRTTFDTSFDSLDTCVNTRLDTRADTCVNTRADTCVNTLDRITVESRDRTTFVACTWYLATAQRAAKIAAKIAANRPATLTANVVNARDPRPKRRVLLLAAGAGVVSHLGRDIAYSVTEHPEPVGTDDRPEKFKTLCLEGPRDVVVAWMHEALDAYRTHVLYGHHDGDGGGIETYEWDDGCGCWSKGRPKRRRPLESLFLSPRAAGVHEDVCRFLGCASAYAKMHLAPRRAYLIYGPCGTAKSSLIHCIASELGCALATIPAAPDVDVRRALSTLPPRCIVAIEDIDCGLADRTAPSFPDLLAALDDCGTDGQPVAVFVTTNRIAKLDRALTRRMDHVVELGHATKEQARRMFATFFDDGFAEFWTKVCAGKTFPMSALEKYLVKCMHDGHPLAHAALFDDLVACATESACPSFYS